MNQDCPPTLLAAEQAYRRHLTKLAETGEGKNGRKVFQAMLRALNALPAKHLDDCPAKTWVWSDLHLGHNNIIRYCNRPFANAEAMNQRLYANWEATVGAEDLLILVGDVAMQDAVCDQTWRRIESGAGRRKELVIGNHDLTGSGQVRVKGFDDISSLLCLHGNPPLLFTHMPLNDVPEGWVNVHGHTHAAPVTESPHINVSVEQIDYRPLALTHIRSLAAELAQGRYPAGCTTLERINNLLGAT